jgi:PAS domain S-box-containing protein
MRLRLTPSSIALLYAAFSGGWIIASGMLLTVSLSDPLLQGRLELAKGLAFVVVSSGLLYLLLRAWAEPPATAKEGAEGGEGGESGGSAMAGMRRPETARVAGLIAALALVVPLLGLAIIQLHGPQVEREAYANLDAVASLKAQQIESWLAERNNDCIGLMNQPELAARLDQLRQQGRASEFAQLLADRIGTLRDPNGYQEILFFDGQGGLITWIADGAAVTSVAPELLQQALQTRSVQRSDPYRDAHGRLHLDWVVPMELAAPAGRVVVVVVLRADFARFLYRTIETWPTVSSSAETVLVQPASDGNAEVVFSPLRFGKEEGGSRVIVRRALLPGVLAQYPQGPVEVAGKDYRGAPVLAAIRPLADVDWRIVAKIDRAELMLPLWDLVLWISLVGFAAVVAITITLLLLWRQQQRAERLASLAEKTKADQLLQQFFNMPFIGIAMISPSNRRWLEFNDRLCEILGYSRHELAELNWSDLTHPDDLADEVVRFERLLRGQTDGYALDKRFIRRDGGVVFAGTDIRCVRQPDGSVAYLVAAVQDISERKSIQLQLEANKEELEEKVRQRTESLEEALLAARRAEQAKDEFLANVSHELRTPLTVVIGLADLALRYEMAAKPREHLEKIANAGRTLSSLINDLLDLSKIAAGRMELEIGVFNPRQTVERVLSIIEQQAKAKNLQLSVQFAPEVEAPLLGDALRIEQVLLNLLSNAIKFTEQGGISLNVSSRSVDAARVRVEFAVTDSGIGLRPGELEGLFQPFAQADASIARRFGGTGLGLALCKRLVELMGGEIGVSSRAGTGSRFAFHLVLPRAPAVAETEAAGREVLPSCRGRVLVVDDQPINREIARELLEAVGVEVQEAANGGEALDLLARHPVGFFDLVLMDVQMPVMDGWAATRRIRMLPGHANLPIVAMTAHTMQHEREKGQAAGMNDHIGKPFDRATFYLVIGHWLRDERGLDEVVPQTGPGGAVEGFAVARDDASRSDAEAVLALGPLTRIEGLECANALARFSGNRERYRYWLGSFVEDSQQFIRQLDELLADGMQEQAQICVHSFKAEVSMLGMPQVYAAVAALEAALAERKPTAALRAECSAEVFAMREKLRAGLQGEPA